MQEILFHPNSDWVAPKTFPNLSAVKKIGIDIESKDPGIQEKGPGFVRGTAMVAGISLSYDDQSQYYPIAHMGGGNANPKAVIAFFKDLLARPDLWVVGANLQYELEGLDSLGIKINGRCMDVQVIEALINEDRPSNSLDSLCQSYLNTTKDEALLREAASAYGIDPKSDMWKLPAKYVGAYASYDALAPVQILEKQLVEIKKQGLEQILTLEMKLLPILWKMRKRGIPIDLDKADQLRKTVKLHEEKLRKEFLDEYGAVLNEWSGPALARLCDRNNVTYPRTAAGNPSFAGDYLSNHEHPMLQAVSKIREVGKMRTSFIDSWIFDNQINGNIHPQWKQCVADDGGTRTGRMAASNPNPQQVPGAKHRDGHANEYGVALRACFGKGQWAKLDYSQQEPRTLVHYAEMLKLTGAKEAADAYRASPTMDFYTYMMEAAGVNRRAAKDMYLGRCYGMGKKRMAERLNKSVEECAEVLAAFDKKVPFVKEIADICSNKATQRGYIKTLLGRRRHFDLYEPIDFDEFCLKPLPFEAAKSKWKHVRRAGTHKALNALIQGSAADMLKAAIVAGYEHDGRYPYMAVHDELDCPSPTQQHADEWKTIMETCVDVKVPLIADLTYGEHWS